jgi:hypothetical protein
MNKRLRNIYNGMKTRCYYENCEAYKNYGGRGITICDEWLNSERLSPRRCSPSKGLVAFVNWALSNGYSDDLTIDRIDVNKGYSPNNCRWITKKEQGFNKRTNHLVTYKGETKTLKEWCDYLHLNYTTIKARINEYHWTVERAFETKENPNVKLITYKGKTLCLKDWCRELNLNYRRTVDRLCKLHWSVEKAFEDK